MKTRNHCLTTLSLAVSLIGISSAYGADEFEFDASFFKERETGRASIDVNRFKFGTPIPAGEHLSDVFVNGKFRGSLLIKFIETDGDPMQGMCWSPELMELLELQPEAVVLKPDSTQCVSAVKALPNLKLNFDIGEQRLNVQVPQALMVIHPDGYIPPSRWQNGVPASFLHYDFREHYDQSENGGNWKSQFLGIRSGMNAGGWALRQQGSQSAGSGQERKYYHHEFYVQRDVDALKGRIRAGDFFSYSNVMDSFGLRGISLSSDDRMLPDSQTGYAPQIQGVANTNAQIKIYHNDNIVYETTVAPGPFVIRDLTLGSYSGEVKVEIIEADGQRRSFVVPFAGGHNLLRPRRLRYALTAGKYRENRKIYDTAVVQGSLQYGLNNQITLQSGAMATSNYASGLFGMVWGGKAGSVSAGWSVNSLTDAEKRKRNGSQFRISYNKFFPQTGTFLQIGTHQNLSRYFYGLQDAVSFKENDSVFSRRYGNPLKSQYQVSVNQSLGKSWGSLYVSGLSRKYRNSKGYQHSYQIGYGNSFRGMQYNMSFSQNQNLLTGKQDKQAHFTLSIPLDRKGLSSNWLSAAHSRDNAGHTYSRVGLSGVYGSQSQFSYGLSLAKPDSGKNQYSAYANYNLPFVKAGVKAHGSGRNRQLSYNLTGAVVAHPYGITLNHEIGDTFAIVRAKGAAGVPIKNGYGSKLDRWGNGIVSSVTPYRLNYIGIDATYLPDNIEVGATEKVIIPRANTASLIDMGAKKEIIAYFDVETQGDSSIPMFAEVKNEHGRVVGYSVQEGRLFVRDIKPVGKLTVSFGENNNNKCVVSYNLEKDKNEYNIYPAKCLPE